VWAFSTPQVTVYSIQPGRGFEQAAVVLGTDFRGFLVRDGWGIYRQFIHALHQTCLAHLLRRCREMLLVAGRGEAEFPRTVHTILQQALQLRDRRQQRQISEHGLAVARGKLEVRMERSLQRRYRAPQNRRLANHLLWEQGALFTFLRCPGLKPRTGEPNRPSAPWWSPARSGVEIEPPAEHRPKAFWSAFFKLAVSNCVPLLLFFKN
jgi:transposase